MHATIWFDGASKGNPGPMAGGAIVEMSGRKTVLHGKPGTGTNNEAEYDGLIIGLQNAVKQGATSVTVRGDSQLVIRQLQGDYAVKAANLKARHAKASKLLQRFQEVSLEWVRRSANAEADKAANDALGR